MQILRMRSGFHSGKRSSKMKVVLNIKRRKAREDKPYQQRIEFSCEEEKMTVALALRKINGGGFLDEKGLTVEPVRFEEGCGQKRCGACAMLINGIPSLACDTILKDGEEFFLEPLKKFPVVSDLLVDRSIMMDNLKTLKLWAEEGAGVSGREFENAYEASLCLQCGCCLEACPNYYSGGSFFSAAAFAPQARLLSSLSNSQRAEVRKLYREHVYRGCGKSLACEKVCPARLPLDRLLSRSNAVKVWHRR